MSVAETNRPKPCDGEWAFLVRGWGECIDGFLAFSLAALAKRARFLHIERGPGNDFTATGHRAMGINVKARDLLDVSITENDRRMSTDEARVLRPNLVPRLAQRSRRFV